MYYEMGLGMQRSIEAALYWYKLAASTGQQVGRNGVSEGGPGSRKRRPSRSGGSTDGIALAQQKERGLSISGTLNIPLYQDGKWTLSDLCPSPDSCQKTGEFPSSEAEIWFGCGRNWSPTNPASRGSEQHKFLDICAAHLCAVPG